jgi:predicted DNA-binding mobile mystery protein A
MSKDRVLIRAQLQASLDRFEPVRGTAPPQHGWIRAVRDALGMSARQLGERMGVSRQRAAFLEKQEIDGSATIKGMRRAAAALDCVFVYALVPRTTLDDTVRSRAAEVAARRMSRATHTMGLEGQGLGDDENEEILRAEIEEIVRSQPADLWDE